MTTVSVRIGQLEVSVKVEDYFARDPRHIYNIRLALIEWARWNVR